MPGFHVHQTQFNVRRDTKALAKSFLRHKVWSRVYAELASGDTTHSSQSWRNFHAKNRAKTQNVLDSYKKRLQQRKEDRSPHSSDDEDVVPPAATRARAEGIPNRGKPGATRRPAPDVNDFLSSDEDSALSESAKDEAEQAELEDEEVDELASSPRRPPPSNKLPSNSKGKQRAVSHSEAPAPQGWLPPGHAPKTKNYVVEIGPPKKRQKRDVPTHLEMDDTSAPKGKSPARPQEPPRGWVMPSDASQYDGARMASEKPQTIESPGHSPTRSERVSHSPIATIHLPSGHRIDMNMVDARIEHYEGPDGQHTFKLSPDRSGQQARAQSASPRRSQPMASSPAKVISRPPISAPAMVQRAAAPPAVQAVVPASAEGEDEQTTEESDGSDGEGAQTQALKAMFGLARERRRDSNASNSSDVVRGQIVPSKRSRTSPLKEIHSSQEHHASDEEEPSAKKATPAGPSPRRLRSRGTASSSAAEEPATPSQQMQVDEAPSTVKPTRRAPRVMPISLSQSELRACYALAMRAKNDGALAATTFEHFHACCGDLKVLMALSLPSEQRTSLHTLAIEQGYWTLEDDERVLKGSLEVQREVEERRGSGSVDFRRNYLELLGQDSAENF